MNLQPHQQRVVTEKQELDEKRHALYRFIEESPTFRSLDEAEQHRLRRQLKVMTEYSAILGGRIDAFTA